MELTIQEAKEIAEILDSGIIIYVNTISREITELMDFTHPYADESQKELWADAIQYVEENWSDLIELRPLPSRDAFYIMEQFVLQLREGQIKNMLSIALSGRKPFARFKDTLRYDDAVLEQWYAFKLEQDAIWVQNYCRREG